MARFSRRVGCDHQKTNVGGRAPGGTGGVDIPALMKNVDTIGWRGFLVVELDASPWRPPAESARITTNYFRKVLKLELRRAQCR